MPDPIAEQTTDLRRPFPEKLFYKIGEVSRISGVESYVLRYWETEFSFLRPRKNKSGQRVYTKKDIEAVLQVKRLLYDERYTIEGVKKKIGGSDSPGQPPLPARAPAKEVVEKIRNRLSDILNQLS